MFVPNTKDEPSLVVERRQGDPSAPYALRKRASRPGARQCAVHECVTILTIWPSEHIMCPNDARIPLVCRLTIGRARSGVSAARAGPCAQKESMGCGPLRCRGSSLDGPYRSHPRSPVPTVTAVARAPSRKAHVGPATAHERHARPRLHTAVGDQLMGFPNAADAAHPVAPSSRDGHIGWDGARLAPAHGAGDNPTMPHNALIQNCIGFTVSPG
jgi:hypothetical protein